MTTFETPTPLQVMEKLAETWAPEAMSDPNTAQRWIELFDENFVLIEPASLPHGGRHVGLDSFQAVQEGMRALWDQRIEATEYWPCGEDRVVLRIVIRWTARSTGRSVELPMIDFITIRAGRITEIEAYVHDTKALLDTLDHLNLDR